MHQSSMNKCCEFKKNKNMFKSNCINLFKFFDNFTVVKQNNKSNCFTENIQDCYLEIFLKLSILKLQIFKWAFYIKSRSSLWPKLFQ